MSPVHARKASFHKLVRSTEYPVHMRGLIPNVSCAIFLLYLLMVQGGCGLSPVPWLYEYKSG